MDNELRAIQVSRKTSSDQIHRDGYQLGHTLEGFWSWSASDLVSNALRGMFAEYLVALDIGVSDGIRTEWDAYDLISKTGVRIEIKSSAYVQSWSQRKLSNISFDISPSRAFETTTNSYTSEKKRQSDVYVFCLLKHKDKQTVDPMNVRQWEFYVVPSSLLNERLGIQKSLSLTTLKSLCPDAISFGDIGPKIDLLFS